MSLFDLIIFDCDGVLVDSEGIANEVLAEVLTGYGLPMSGEAARSNFIGRSVQDIRLMVADRSGIAMPENWSAGYYELLLPALADRVKPTEGVTDVVRHLQQIGVPFCVASQGPIEKIRTTLTSAGLWEAFDGRVYSAKSVKHPKPAPDLFLYAAESCGAVPHRCAVIEDSALGVQAGIAASMTVFAYCPPENASAMEGWGRLLSITCPICQAGWG